LGRVQIDQEVGNFSGKAWSFQIETEDTASGLGISLVLGDSLPPYFTWLEKERLYLPIATSEGPRMVHRLDQGPEVRWRVLPPADTYFRQTYACDEEVCLVDAAPVGQVLCRRLAVAGDALRETHHFEADLWSQSERVTTKGLPFFALPRPLGLGELRSLRTSDAGVAGAKSQFWVMDNPDGCCGRAWCESCIERVAVAASLGFKTAAIGSDKNALAMSYGMHTIPIIGCPWLFDGATDPDYECVRTRAQDLDVDGLLFMSLGSEPIDAGVDMEDLYEAAYQIRVVNQHKPFDINYEPSLKWAREVRDLVEIATEEHYLERGWIPSRTPLCELVTVMEEMRRNTRVDVPLRLHILGGFFESERYLTATPDEVGAHALTALLMGASAVDLFMRFSHLKVPDPEERCQDCSPPLQYDWATDNPVLWSALEDGLAEDIDRVRGWLNRVPPYFVRFGPTGEFVTECGREPMLSAAGVWLEEAQAGSVGTWFAFVNLGEEHTKTVVIPWADLNVPEGWSFLQTVSESTGGLVALGVQSGVSVTCTLDPGCWYVGVLVSDDPEDVAGAEAIGYEDLRLEVGPNPFSDKVLIKSSLSDARLRGVVYSPDGRIVRDLGIMGEESFWDGKNSEGRNVAAGFYVLKVVGPRGESHRVPLIRVR
jgi:hypothetical protein